MRTWNNKPLKSEVEQMVKEFFELLKEGKLEQAKDTIAHKFDDWDHQIHSLWADTHLIFLEDQDIEIEDDSFEGELWKKDLNWLKKLVIGDIQWDEDDQSQYVENENRFFSLYIGYDESEDTDVSGTFYVDEHDGKYYVVRESIGIR